MLLRQAAEERAAQGPQAGTHEGHKYQKEREQHHHEEVPGKIADEQRKDRDGEQDGFDVHELHGEAEPKAVGGAAFFAVVHRPGTQDAEGQVEHVHGCQDLEPLARSRNEVGHEQVEHARAQRDDGEPAQDAGDEAQDVTVTVAHAVGHGHDIVGTGGERDHKDISQQQENAVHEVLLNR